MNKKLLNGKVLDNYFRDFFRPLTVFAYTIIKDEKVAEDIVQDVFVNLYEQVRKNKYDGLSKSYLYKSVHNRCMNVIKFRKVRIEHSPHLTEAICEKPCDPFQVVAKIELEHKFLEALEALSPKCRTIFKMSRLNGLSNDEIAKKLSLSKRTVETQISKALKVLRRKLEKYIKF